MQLYPTRPGVELAVVSALATLVAVFSANPIILAWTGSLLVGLTLARVVTRVSVARIRNAGFEMLWGDSDRTKKVARGEQVTLKAEIRNRDSRAARFAGVRCVCSPNLVVQASPPSGEVAGGGRFRVDLTVSAERVGRHGVHGISLELQGENGLFEVPLTFANPMGIEVLPRAFGLRMRSAYGGRSRLRTDAGRSAPWNGERGELRELRDHQPGDPMRKIAWRASAKRGKLLAREYEQEERDVVWLALDASVELWAGPLGEAPLDRAIDQVAATASFHASQGDPVGLVIVGARTLAWHEPARGAKHLSLLSDSLMAGTSCLDLDRSDMNEAEVARRVYEHLRPLDPQLARVRARDYDRLLRRAERALRKAPFKAAEPFANSSRERRLRRYFAAFGLYAPPRLEPDRPKTDLCFARALSRIFKGRQRPSVLYLWSSPPSLERQPDLKKALSALPRRVDLRWVSMRVDQSLPRGAARLSESVADALEIRLAVARRRGERSVRKLGFRVVELRARATVGRAP